MISNNAAEGYCDVRDERGVVLLIAIVIASLVLAITIGISTIVAKEIILNSLTKNSEAAFFTADSGVECAMHWDLITFVAAKRGVGASYPSSIFATSSANVTNFNSGTVFGGVPLTDARFNYFCAGQTTSQVFGTNISTYFPAITTSASWIDTNGDAVGDTASTQFVFFPRGTVSKSEPCSLVTVTKKYDSVTFKTDTNIFSEGLSTCDSSDTRRVSRGINVSYVSW